MAHFEATVRVFDLNDQDALLARHHIEEGLRAAGFSRWQIVGLAMQGAERAARPRQRPRRADVNYIGGGLMVTAVAAWTLWFLWLLGS
jgi:hypothetical protein